MTERFRVISLYRRRGTFSVNGRVVAPTIAEAELFFPSIGMTLRGVKISKASDTIRVHVPAQKWNGRLLFQIGDAPLLEAIRQVIERLLPTAPVWEDDPEEVMETPKVPGRIFAIFPGVEPLRR